MVAILNPEMPLIALSQALRYSLPLHALDQPLTGTVLMSPTTLP